MWGRSLVSLLMGLYKLKEQTAGKTWAVFSGGARVTDRFD
jgi:hypothetical protein